MVKIKRKVEMTKEEFAKHLIEKGDIKQLGRSVRSEDSEIYNVHFKMDRGIINSLKKLGDEGNVSFETYEEIDEDTELNEIFLITNNSIYSERYYNYSINDVLSDNEGYYEELAMLVMQPKPIIIWTHEKGLVE
ncbi:hypothetical protein [Staphylococcus ureilyticus]|uniref:hypothetical protein n=1 Tax=Staphylococcus ureilyticus TaxID=94138 RepID=UPI00227A7C56|nr:hypothetical protein [Staphylococcus ureilyticus]